MTRSLHDIDSVVDEYEMSLRLDRGLSDNSCDGYLRDLRRLLGWLAEGGISLRDVTTDTLRLYLGDLHDLGIAELTRARMMSGLRSL
ncbi:MAG: site-specific integrase, partial [Duncaniella sp.]|nr:site-specific integrase [Duncaniella sp.]